LVICSGVAAVALPCVCEVFGVIALGHVDRGDPLMDPLVFLVVDDLRSAHRFLLCWE